MISSMFRWVGLEGFREGGREEGRRRKVVVAKAEIHFKSRQVITQNDRHIRLREVKVRVAHAHPQAPSPSLPSLPLPALFYVLLPQVAWRQERGRGGGDGEH